jgi:hypothetical protein
MPLQDPYQQSNTGVQGHIITTSQWVGCSISSRHIHRMILTWRTRGRARRRCREIVGRLSFMMMIDVGLILLESVSGVGEDTHKIPISYFPSVCLRLQYTWLAPAWAPYPALAFVIFMHACISGVFVELVDSTLLNWKNSKKEVFGLVWFAWMEHYWNLMMGSLRCVVEMELELHWGKTGWLRDLEMRGSRRSYCRVKIRRDHKKRKINSRYRKRSSLLCSTVWIRVNLPQSNYNLE